ncbi:MAG: hypothetical protein ACI3XS_05090 [Eubacteriales bacterium]
MKKFFALLLVIFALLPYLVACGVKKPDNTDNTDTKTDTATVTDTTTDTGKGDDEGKDVTKIYSKETVLKNWDGKTLNILATRWYTENPQPPWSVIELCVTERDDPSGFGARVNNSILDRAKYIQDTYGVKLNWIQVSYNGVPNAISTAIKDNKAGEKYHLAMPRVVQAQDIVQSNLLYDMASSKYIDFSQSYFSQAAHEAYTVAGHTFYAAGDSSFLDEWTTDLIFFNKTMAEDRNQDLYGMVKAGTWTIDKLIEIAKATGADIDGDPEWTDKDAYGFAFTVPSMLITSSGIQQVKVDPDTGLYKLSLNDDKIGLVIDKIIQLQGAEWCRSSWGSYYAPVGALKEGRLLFLQEVVQHIDDFNDVKDIEVGVLPLPKLSEKQEDYATTCWQQAVLLCIPRTTDDREFSEYFVDVLSWTGQEYVMKKLYEKLNAALPDDDGLSFEILKDYIFDKIVYDNGIFYTFDGLFKDLSQSWSSGQNKFTEVYGDASLTARSIVDGKKTGWNVTWKNYKD